MRRASDLRQHVRVVGMFRRVASVEEAADAAVSEYVGRLREAAARDEHLGAAVHGRARGQHRVQLHLVVVGEVERAHEVLLGEGRGQRRASEDEREGSVRNPKGH